MKSRQKFLYIGLFLILLCCIVVWIYQIKQGNMPLIDQWTRGFVETVRETFVYSIFRFGTELGSQWFVQPLTIITTIIIWFVYKNFRPAFIFGLGVLGTHLLNKLIKGLVARERPSISAVLDAEGYSFPSGHAMVSIVCYGLIAYFINCKLKSATAKWTIYIFFACIILWIGMSRYIINVHYITDVISGYTIGFIVLICLIKLYRILTDSNPPISRL